MCKDILLKYSREFNCYATEDGDVFLNSKFIKRASNIICTDALGYNRVICRIDKKDVSVARIILSAFNPIENMKNFDADHIDSNTLNNKLENLQWITNAQNKAKYSIDNTRTKGIEFDENRKNKYRGEFCRMVDGRKKRFRTEWLSTIEEAKEKRRKMILDFYGDSVDGVMFS